MQDIGGCRAVVPDADDAFRLAADFANSRIRHEPLSYKNYIDHPRPSGYRGLHLVYGYNSERTEQWQGLKTEIQIRSRLQHQWATAVETVGTFTGNDLKSNMGDATWLRFFALMSTVIAQLENTPIVPKTPTSRNVLVSEIRECERKLGISGRLAAFQSLTSGIENLRGIKNHWVVLELNLYDQVATGRAFKPNELEAASSLYTERELENRGNPMVELVLVSARSLNELRRAYPNFFADLAEFRHLVWETIE